MNRIFSRWRTRWTISAFTVLILLVLIFIQVFSNKPLLSYAANGTRSSKIALISQGRPAIASSVESVLYPPEAAVDGNPGTRWSSAYSDNQWLAIDFGRIANIGWVELQWEAAYAKQYQLQVSNDGLSWINIYTQNNGQGGTETIRVSGQGRYIQLSATQRATSYGYSLWEFKVYGQIASPTVTQPPSESATSTPISPPDTAAIPTPTPTLAGGSHSSPSGQAMPVGDLPGWHQIFTEDFHTDAPIGSFPGTAYGDQFTVYPDGTPDTAGQKGAPSRYYPSKVVSVSNGLLNLHLHTEQGTPMAAAILPVLHDNHLYGKYTIRFRSDSLHGFKTAWLLWPDSETWPRDGEIDFPEGDLSQRINAYMHYQGASSGGEQDAFSTAATYASWHTASIEWLPDKVNFILDDQVIGTSTAHIPNTPMHWVIQTESCMTGCPASATDGNLQIAWVVAYSMA